MATAVARGRATEAAPDALPAPAAPTVRAGPAGPRPSPLPERSFLARPGALARGLGPALLLLAALLGALVTIGTRNLAFAHGFIAGNPPPPAPYGDEYQTTYFLWLWAHALGTFGHLPFSDVTQFTGLGFHLDQPFGWPLALLTVPVDALAGPVAAYNVAVLASFPASALAAAALARAIGTSRAGAAVAGFAYAFEPFRVAQATGHVNALLAPLLPALALVAELALRRRGPTARRAAWAAVPLVASVGACGDYQTALSGAGVLVGWVALRAPGVPRAHLRSLLEPGIAAGAAGLALAGISAAAVLLPSSAASGRSAAAAAEFAPHLSDLVARVPVAGAERYVYLGVAIAGLAAAGLTASLLASERRGLGLGLSAGCVLGLFLAIAPSEVHHPALVALARAFPLQHLTRTPGRVDLAVGLALALLAGLGVDAVRLPQLRVVVGLVGMAAIVAELPPGLFAANPVPPRLSAIPPHAVVLDLPTLGPGDARGSAYALEVLGRHDELVGGYTPFATERLEAAEAGLVALEYIPVDACAWRAIVARHHVGYVAVHVGIFDLLRPTSGEREVAALAATPGFSRVEVAQPGDVVVFRIDPSALPPCPSLSAPAPTPGGPTAGRPQ